MRIQCRNGCNVGALACHVPTIMVLPCSRNRPPREMKKLTGPKSASIKASSSSLANKFPSIKAGRGREIQS